MKYDTNSLSYIPKTIFVKSLIKFVVQEFRNYIGLIEY